MSQPNHQQIQLIPLEQIIPLPSNVTVIGREEDLMLRTDMTRLESRGLYKIDPILLRRLGPEEIAEIKAKQPWSQAKYMICDGHSRWRAARELGWMQIRAIIIDCTLEEAYAINYTKNKARGNVDPLREAAYFKHLYEDLKMTQEKIAEKFGLDRTRVTQILKRVGITPEARRIIVTRVTMEKPLSGKHLEVIGSAPPEKQVELTEAIIEHKLGFREADLVRRAVEKGVPTEKAVQAVKTLKEVAKPKQAERLFAVAKPELLEEIPKLPKEKLKAKVEEALKPPLPPTSPEESAFKRFLEEKIHYPKIMVDYVYSRYKGENLKDVLRATVWLLWSELDEAKRETIVRKAIEMVEKRGFEEPVTG